MRFYERAFYTKWVRTVLVVGGGAMGALASGYRPLIALAGIVVALFGLACVRDCGALATALTTVYKRRGMSIPSTLVRFVGGGFVCIGTAWTIAALASLL